MVGIGSGGGPGEGVHHPKRNPTQELRFQNSHAFIQIDSFFSWAFSDLSMVTYTSAELTAAKMPKELAPSSIKSPYRISTLRQVCLQGGVV